MNEITYNNLISIEKIKNIYTQIRSSTKHKRKIIKFEMNFTSNVSIILYELENHLYSHSGYEVFLIKDPKYRIIMSENMHDKIINHLVSKYALLPIIQRKLINTNVAARKGMGTKKAIYYLKKYINAIKNNYDNIYVLQCDITKYFYNIDHDILLNKLKKDIVDKDLYELVKKIIKSTDVGHVNYVLEAAIEKERNNIKKGSFSKKEKEYRFKALDEIPKYTEGRGLPIGNESSQMLAIYYLNDLDHYIKEKLHIKYYIRYMDDFILIHHDKEYLKECLKKIEYKIQEFHLSLNKKTQILDFKRGINFLGYKFKLKNKKLIIQINQQNKKKIKRKLKKLKKKNLERYNLVVPSYKGYLQVANSKEFMHSLGI